MDLTLGESITAHFKRLVNATLPYPKRENIIPDYYQWQVKGNKADQNMLYVHINVTPLPDNMPNAFKMIRSFLSNLDNVGIGKEEITQRYTIGNPYYMPGRGDNPLIVIDTLDAIEMDRSELPPDFLGCLMITVPCAPQTLDKLMSAQRSCTFPEEREGQKNALS